MKLHASTTLAALPLLALFAAAPALAEGPSAATSWSGAYVGATLGAGYLTTDQYSPPQLTYGGYDAASYDGWHPYAGIQAGLDVQLGATVLGLKLQHIVTNSDGDSFMKVDELISSNAVALTSLAARAGYLFQPNLLGYVNASVVAGHFNYASVDERWGLVDDSLNAMRIGAGLGAGLELRLSEQLSVFAEYNHVQFATGSSTFDYGSAYPSNWTYDYTHSLGLVQAGLNYRF
ncbi:MAG: porin family protein [Hyphomicrobiales bacterium]|nr:MAG: porin family protein [Hyphomicrobiales bacterium]